jgi:hypothetical protein
MFIKLHIVTINSNTPRCLVSDVSNIIKTYLFLCFKSNFKKKIIFFIYIYIYLDYFNLLI